jgi:hypothetical protein
MISHRRSYPPLLPALALTITACGGDDLTLPPTPPGQIQLVEGDDQVGPPDTRLPKPLIVRLVDDAGHGIPGRAVVWVVIAGNGSVDPTTGTTDADGFASAEWTLGPAPGTNQVEAQVPAIATVRFTATAEEGDPTTHLEAVAGERQSAPAGAAVPIPPAVRIVDEQDEPVSGVEVTFTVTGGGGSVDGGTAVSDDEGVARVGRWTLGPGTNTLEASAAGVGGTVVFTAEGTSAEAQVDRLVYRTAPGDVRAGDRFTVEVALVDSDGEIVPLSGIFVYVGLMLAEEGTIVNKRLDGERFENTENGVAVLQLAVNQRGRYRLRALTDDLPALGEHGPEPWLVSDVFEVN